MDSMIKAYQQTIEDLKIDLRNTSIFAFKRRRQLQRFITKYQKLINESQKDLVV